MVVKMWKDGERFVFSAVVMILGLTFTAPAFGERIDPPSSELEGVGISQKLGEKIDLNLVFTDEEGEKVSLREYFEKGVPVGITLNYYECPMLCTLQLNGLVDALKEISLVPGKDFQLITVSINPNETHELAKLKKSNYLKAYGRAGASVGWHFLTGDAENIRKLTEAVGFNYRFDPKTGEFAHVAVLVLLTPKGEISRYLADVLYDPKILRLSLVEASRGKIGNAIDQIFLYCFRYSSETGRYTPIVLNIVRIVSALVLMALLVVLGIFWLLEFKKRNLVMRS